MPNRLTDAANVLGPLAEITIIFSFSDNVVISVQTEILLQVTGYYNHVY